MGKKRKEKKKAEALPPTKQKAPKNPSHGKTWSVEKARFFSVSSVFLGLHPLAWCCALVSLLLHLHGAFLSYFAYSKSRMHQYEVVAFVTVSGVVAFLLVALAIELAQGARLRRVYNQSDYIGRSNARSARRREKGLVIATLSAPYAAAEVCTVVLLSVLLRRENSARIRFFEAMLLSFLAVAFPLACASLYFYWRHVRRVHYCGKTKPCEEEEATLAKDEEQQGVSFPFTYCSPVRAAFVSLEVLSAVHLAHLVALAFPDDYDDKSWGKLEVAAALADGVACLLFNLTLAPSLDAHWRRRSREKVGRGADRTLLKTLLPALFLTEAAALFNSGWLLHYEVRAEATRVTHCILYLVHLVSILLLAPVALFSCYKLF